MCASLVLGQPDSLPRTEAQLADALATKPGCRRPTEEELRLLLIGRSIDKTFSPAELKDVVLVWELYQAFKDDIDLMFYLYDGDHTGKISGTEAAHLLRELNGGVELAKWERKAIQHHMSSTPSESMSRLAVVMMIARWQALIPPETKKQAAPSEAPKDNWNCTMQ